MKKITYALLATVAAAAMTSAVSSSAFAQGPYVSVGGGLSQPEDSGIAYHIPGTAPATPAENTFDMGFMASGALGYKWDRGFRTEAEFNYRQSSINDIAGAGSPGKQRVMGLMTNVLYDIGNNESFRPYVGGGVGVGWNKWRGVQGAPSATFPGGTPVFSDRDAAFQWQAIGGITHPLSERVDSFVEYRYIGLENNKFNSSLPFGSAASQHDDRSHNLLIGVRFNFG